MSDKMIGGDHCVSSEFERSFSNLALAKKNVIVTHKEWVVTINQDGSWSTQPATPPAYPSGRDLESLAAFLRGEGTQTPSGRKNAAKGPTARRRPTRARPPTHEDLEAAAKLLKLVQDLGGTPHSSAGLAAAYGLKSPKSLKAPLNSLARSLPFPLEEALTPCQVLDRNGWKPGERFDEALKVLAVAK